jgi:ADP-heptose:LPS heptosyltransferase
LREVLANVSWIDEIIEYYPREVFSGPGAGAAFLRRIRSCQFDVFIELCNDVARIRTLVRNIFFARLAGVGWAGGWSINTLRFAVQQQSKYIDFPNEVDRLMQDVERCGISAGKVGYQLPVTPSQEQWVAAIPGIAEPSDSRRIIAIAPGAKRPASRWPVERFIEVGRQMAKSGYRIVVLGSDEERDLAERIGVEVGTACVNLAGMTDISGMAAILKKCTLLICNDSGPQHIASAVGTPCVSISSFWHLRGKWRAHNPRSIVLQKMVPCHTCFQYDCPNDNICLTEISADEAAAAAFIILDDVVSPDSVCSVGREHRSVARDNASSGAILKAPPPC